MGNRPEDPIALLPATAWERQADDRLAALEEKVERIENKCRESFCAHARATNLLAARVANLERFPLYEPGSVDVTQRDVAQNPANLNEAESLVQDRTEPHKTCASGSTDESQQDAISQERETPPVDCPVCRDPYCRGAH